MYHSNAQLFSPGMCSPGTFTVGATILDSSQLYAAVHSTNTHTCAVLLRWKKEPERGQGEEVSYP